MALGIGAGMALGGVMGLMGAQQQASATKSAANKAAEMARFDPYNVYGQGIGGATFGQAGVPPWMQQPYSPYGGTVMPTPFGGIPSGMLGGGGGMGGGLFGGAARGLMGNMAGAAMNQSGGGLPPGITPEHFEGGGTITIGGKQYGAGDFGFGGSPAMQGGGGGGYNPQASGAPTPWGGPDRQLNIQLDPQMEGFRQQLLQGAGQDSPLFGQTGQLFSQAGQNMMGFGGLAGQAGSGLVGSGQGLFNRGMGAVGQAMSQSPMDAAKTQYDLAQQLMAPGREKARTSLENRLFAQGRLGSTGGIGDIEAQREANRMGDVRAAYDSLGQGRAAQAQMFGQGMDVLGRGSQTIGQGIGFGQAGANMLGQGAGLFGQQIGLEQQALDRRLQQLQGARSMAQDPLQLANLGVGIGGRQAAAGAAAAPMMFQAGQANPGANMLMGFGQTLAGNPSLFNNPYTDYGEYGKQVTGDAFMPGNPYGV